MAFGTRRPARGEPRTPPRQPARSYALWLLSKREYSARTLLERLVNRGYAQADAQAALELLQHHGLQSDERFASMKARSSASRAGDRRIRMQLTQAGIDAQTVTEQLQALEPESERALTAARRFASSARDERTRARFWRHLASRGFSMSVVARTWEAMAEEMVSPTSAASERFSDESVEADE